jgi:hypothetical protein
VEAHPSFSSLSKHLFSQMTKIKSHQRYTALEALQHPWITRMKQNRIPRSKMEEVQSLKSEFDLR